MGVCVNEKYINNSLFNCNSLKGNKNKVINLELKVEENINKNVVKEIEKDNAQTLSKDEDDNKKPKEKEQVISHKLQTKYKQKFFNYYNPNVNNNNSKNIISVKSNDLCEKLIYFTNLNLQKKK